jgi:hypothetical protein
LLIFDGDSKNFEQVISRLQKTIMRNARTSPVQMSWMTGAPRKNIYLDMAKGDLRRSKKLTEEEALKLIQRQHEFPEVDAKISRGRALSR